MSNVLQAPSSDEIDRGAFNAAFYELGLRWHWDASTYATLAGEPCERSRVRRYLDGEQAHLLRAYDAHFLTDAILVAKERRRHAPARGPPRPLLNFNRPEARRGETGI